MKRLIAAMVIVAMAMVITVPAFARDVYEVKENTFVTKTLAEAIEIYDYCDDDDSAAVIMMIDQNRAAILNKGVNVVILENIDIFAKIRIVGTTYKVWTVRHLLGIIL